MKFKDNIRAVWVKMIENGSSIEKISSNIHCQEPVAQGYKHPENQLILIKPQLQGRLGQREGEHFQHLTNKWAHFTLGTDLCQT